MKLVPFLVVSLFSTVLVADDVTLFSSESPGSDFTVEATGKKADEVWNALLKKPAKASLEWSHRSYRGDSDDNCVFKIEIDSVQCTFTQNEEDRDKAYLEFGFGEKGFCGSADLLPEIRIIRSTNSARATLTLAEAALLTERLDRTRHPTARCRLRVR